MNLEEIKKRVEDIQKQMSKDYSLTLEEQQMLNEELLQLASQIEIELLALKIE